MAAHSKPIVNFTRASVVCETAVVADRPFTRMRGLLGRSSLPAGEGLLLQPAPSIHTAFMRFPIDVIFLDRNLQVVKLVETLGPWRMASARHAQAVIELAAGEVAVRGVEIGDSLGLVTVTASAGAGETGRNGGEDQPLMPTDGATDTIRVLLVSKDRRFRLVTSALLTRLGCTVSLGERLEFASMRSRQEGPHVVVIDGYSAPAAAAHQAAEIQAITPHVGVVLVGDKPNGAMAPVPLLAKWAPFDELYAAIKSARPQLNRRRSNDRH